MPALTPAERRGGAMLVLLLLLGTAYDLWRAHAPTPLMPRDPAADTPADVSRPDSAAALGVAPARDSVASPARLDLNRATAAELDALPGIGPVLAQRIVEHRRLHGRFRRIEELRAVRGVGPRLFARVAPRLRVDP